jgi:prepilin-type N-terminal cleavage/methylation domain-containing protein
MNSAKSNPLQRDAAWRPLPVAWLECPDIIGRVRLRRTLNRLRIYGSTESRPTVTPRGPVRRSSAWRSEGGFTILELMIVIGIIGLLAGMALPHLRGFTSGSAMTAATRQLIDDVALARQRAMANRSQVCMVFIPPDFWTNDQSQFTNAQIVNLANHQYAAYAMISLRSVGDQPGRSNVHYLTDWRYLPQGTLIAPFQLTMTNGSQTLFSNLVSVTNTTTGLSNGWYASSFPTDILFPFPSTFNATSNTLPYICFTPSGQLKAGSDQFILLASGSVLSALDPNTGLPQINFTTPAAPSLVETPPNNEFSNPNVIHIDWLTGRARLEQNQF